jgi:hypothetical protein
MDSFLYSLQKEDTWFPHDYLYILGMTSIFIAAKMHEEYMLGIETLLQELGHGKFKKSEVLIMERKILQALNFHIPSKNIYEESLLRFKFYSDLN